MAVLSTDDAPPTYSLPAAAGFTCVASNDDDSACTQTTSSTISNLPVVQGCVRCVVALASARGPCPATWRAHAHACPPFMRASGTVPDAAPQLAPPPTPPQEVLLDRGGTHGLLFPLPLPAARHRQPEHQGAAATADAAQGWVGCAARHLPSSGAQLALRATLLPCLRTTQACIRACYDGSSASTRPVVHIQPAQSPAVLPSAIAPGPQTCCASTTRAIFLLMLAS